MPRELYHLPEDPAEQNDLAATYPSAIAWFEALIENARVDNPEYYPGLPPDRTLGDKE